jgi:hypothetical protein
MMGVAAFTVGFALATLLADRKINRLEDEIEALKRRKP